jgi:galactokinase
VPSTTRSTSEFSKHFGREPAIVSRAPGRVNLIGEHIDYNGGLVLPMAIELDCAVAAARSPDHTTRIIAVDVNGERWEVSGELNAQAVRDSSTPGAWQSYVGGSLACLAEKFGQALPPMDLVVTSDVPLGSGLASSASLELAVIRAAAELAGFPWDAPAMAFVGQRAEHEFAGVPCGIMDQMVSAAARAGHALLIDCADPSERRDVPMPSRDQAVLLVIDTGVRHSLASGEYAARAKATKAAAAALGVRHLCQADERKISGLSAMLGAETMRLARHVVTEQARVLETVDALEDGDLERVGELMIESHDSLRNDYRVSCDELDDVVDAATEQEDNGVFGARMTGGGFGGSAIALVAPDAVGEVVATIRRRFVEAYGREPRTFVSGAAAGASLLA